MEDNLSRQSANHGGNSAALYQQYEDMVVYENRYRDVEDILRELARLRWERRDFRAGAAPAESGPVFFTEDLRPGAWKAATSQATLPPSRCPASGAPTLPGKSTDVAIDSSPLPALKVSSVAPSAQTPVRTAAPFSFRGDSQRETGQSSRPFASAERMRTHQTREAQRATLKLEKSVLLDELKKFAATFKLTSRVPDDLVPLLANDREKQIDIQTKAEAAANDDELRRPLSQVLVKDANVKEAESRDSHLEVSSEAKTADSTMASNSVKTKRKKKRGKKKSAQKPALGLGGSTTGAEVDAEFKNGK